MKSCSKDTATTKKIGRYFSLPFFGNLIRRSWPVMVFIAIVQFFVVTLFNSFSIRNLSYYTTRSFDNTGAPAPLAECYQLLHENLVNQLNASGISVMLLIGGIVCGIIGTAFLNTRKQTYFLHSLPLTREAIYCGKYLTAALSFLIPFTVNMLPLTVLIYFTEAKMSVMLPVLLTLWLKGIAWFLFFYTFSFVVSLLCSGHVVKFMLVVMSLYYLPLMYTLILFLGDNVASHLDISYYSQEDILNFLSPGIRIFTAYFGDLPMKPYEWVLLTVTTLIILVLGLFIYRLRGSENSEKTIVFRRLGRVLQFWVLVPGTGVGGLALYVMSDAGEVWPFFGFALGAFLTFLITNALLAKNAKEMFRKFWRLVIFFAVFLAVFFGLIGLFRALDDYIPAASGVKYVEVELGGAPAFILTDKAEIGHANALALEKDNFNDSLADKVHVRLDRSATTGREYYYEYDYYPNETAETMPAVTTESRDIAVNPYDMPYYVEYSGFMYTSLNLRYKLNNGIVLAKTYLIVVCEERKEELQVLLDSEAFKAAYIDVYDPAAWHDMSNGYCDIYYNAPDGNRSVSYVEAEALSLIRAAVYDARDSIGFDYFQNTACGRYNINYKDVNGRHSYLSDAVFLQDLDEGDTRELVYDNLSAVTKAEVYGNNDAETPILTTEDPDMILQLMHSAVATPNNRRSAFTVPANDYCVVFYTILPPEVEAADATVRVFITNMIADKIPAFVAAP